MSAVTDVAIIGAGPYGLSVAAHLVKARIMFRIFGTPMASWSQGMPKGMMLKSEGFASDLFDPDGAYPLRKFCAERGIPYEDVGMPVSRETFVAYGEAFQRRMVPHLEDTQIEMVQRTSSGFMLRTAQGETLEARRVVVAAGITHFSYTPDVLTGLDREHVTHTSEHHDLGGFAGKRVAVVGGGSSAVDMAALLHEAGAEVELVARRDAIVFHQPTPEPRPMSKQLAMPRSGLGLGWRSRLVSDLPGVFHLLPRKFRLRIVRSHLGPSVGWFVRDKFVGRVTTHLQSTVRRAAVEDGMVVLQVANRNGAETELRVDHVIAGTGFRPAVSRLRFLDGDLRRQVVADEDAPVLSRNYESSVPGLYFVGVAAANAFGPVSRFAVGAKYAARKVSGHLAAKAQQAPVCTVVREAVPQLSGGQAG